MKHITSVVLAIGIITLVTSNSLEGGPTAAPTVKNVVLVHGAFADGSSYAKVIPLLEAKGLHVTAVQNPLSSLADDVAATKRAIANQDGPVILVGHSWAGMVISEAGNDPKVAGLVYVAALVPDEGQSASDVVKPYPPGPGLGEAKPDAAGFLSLTRKGIDEDFVPDVPAAEQAIVYATQGRWNSACLGDKVSVPAWKTKPSWFIAVNDRMLSPEYEQAIAKHIHATTTTLPTGHVPMLSKPKDVAAVIIEAANKLVAALDVGRANAQSVFPANFRTQEIQTDGATIHARVGGQGPAVVLLHGFGDTGDMWALMAADLAHDHRVVVPDLRGMGLSSHPAGGYDKKTQAADIRSVLTQLGIDRAAVVGHDIGATVAYAYAARYPAKTDRLVVMDAPVPGIPPWDEIVRSPALWHFSFGGPDAERLVAGRERIYLDRFWNEFAGDPSKIDEATRARYTAFYAQPGAMHSAFAQFLSIPKDAEDNKVSMTTKLTMPVLAIGAAKMFGANEAIVMRNAADNVTETVIENSGHWLMEEQPTATIAAVRNFLAGLDVGRASPSSVPPLSGVLGQVKSVTPNSIEIGTKSGVVSLEITQPVTTYRQVPSDLSQVTSDSYIGVASEEGPNGTEIAKQIIVFPAELRGAAEGSVLLDAPAGAASHNSRMTNGSVSRQPVVQPRSRMTNGVLQQGSRTTLVVRYQDGTRTVSVPGDVSVTKVEAGTVTIEPGGIAYAVTVKKPNGELATSSILLVSAPAPQARN